MDLFRYFKPHHNPKLHDIPPRSQEFFELLQAAKEFSLAVQRAQVRIESSSKIRQNGIMKIVDHDTNEKIKNQLGNCVLSLNFIESALSHIIEKIPPDSLGDLEDLIKEREGLVGWENWVMLLKESLSSMNDSKFKSGTSSF